MDFIHCMRCGHWPLIMQENRLRYFFSSCGRLHCENCIAILNNKCMCQSEQCKILELQNPSVPEVKTLFMDPMALLQDAMRKSAKVIQFQSNMQKNCLRIAGRLVENNKAAKSENTSLKSQYGSLKLENDHLRQANEQLKQQIEQLKSQMKAMSQSQSNSFLDNSPRSIHRSNSQINCQNDPLNLFREERPNAQVPPNVHRHQPSDPSPPVRSAFVEHRAPSFTNGFVMPSPARSVSSSSNQSQLFSQMSGFSQPFSVPRCNDSPASFGTPSSISQLNSGIQSPFIQRNDSGLGSMLEGRTPDIINRLRNIKCRATPNSSQQGFRS